MKVLNLNTYNYFSYILGGIDIDTLILEMESYQSLNFQRQGFESAEIRNSANDLLGTYSLDANGFMTRVDYDLADTES